MKKENRKMAQERRAKERQKQEQRRKLKKICMVGIPLLILAVLIIFLATSSSDSSTDGSDASADTSSSDTTADNEESADTTDSPVVLTDTSLTVEDGDTVNIDFVGSIDGVEFEGGSTEGTGTDLVIGSGSYIDDFEEQLIGAHPGDTVDVYVTFPEDYGDEELNGKEALFVVTINGIYE